MEQETGLRISDNQHFLLIWIPQRIVIAAPLFDQRTVSIVQIKITGQLFI